MEFGDFEDVVNCALMVLEVGMGSDAYIIHIDADCCPKRFVFENNVTIYVVHHHLERHWGVGESEIHNGRFEKPISGFECGFLLISFTNLYVVITPSDIKFCVYVCVTEVSNEVHN